MLSTYSLYLQTLQNYILWKCVRLFLIFETADTLRKELIAIESRLEECKGEEDELLIDQTRKEQKFDNDMTALNGKNDGLVNQLRRAESQTEGK